MVVPAASGLFIPGEWAPHERCWMAWPCRAETFKGEIDAAREAYAAVAQAIARFEPVTMVCNSEDAAEASVACGSGIQVMPMAISDSWLRDTGPGFLVDGKGRRGGVHWRFNAWGGLYDGFQADATVGRRILEHLKIPVIEAPFVLEGGAFQSDGEGTLLTTEQCLLDPRRNDGLNRDDIEELLKAYTGSSHIIWLGEGYQDDETNGHVDEIALFVRPGVVLALTTDDPSDGNFKRFQDNLDRLRGAKDAAGREIQVIPVKQPDRQDGTGGIRLTLSYTNLYIANGGVVIPGFEDEADHDAYKTIRKCFPQREVVQVPAFDIVRGGGGIHCITLAEPKAG